MLNHFYVMESSERDQLESEVEKAIVSLRLTMLRRKAREIEKTDGKEAVAERLSEFDYYVDKAIRNSSIVSLSEQVIEEIESTSKQVIEDDLGTTSEEDIGSTSEEDNEVKT